jgi:hypothetical protein
MKFLFFCFALIPVILNCRAQSIDLSAIKTPILFQGNNVTAYRDPAVMYYQGKFHLFFTMVEIEQDGNIYSYTAQSKSNDLVHWDTPQKITPKNQELNYCSPGNVINYNGEWILCLQTYPRPGHALNHEARYGNGNARLYIMRSKDLKNWSNPELLKVKGPDIPVSEMGRMIDPYLLEDKDIKGKWWCFYKQNGVSMSYSSDLKNWTFFGYTESGENVCVLVENDEYILFHSPKNGIGIKKSKDLKTWADWGELNILGQAGWDWAKGRITAGAVIELEKNPVARYLMFFHGSGPLTEEEGDFDKNASIGIAWSNDLINWNWPGKTNKQE